jgi:hypothetical protein
VRRPAHLYQRLLDPIPYPLLYQTYPNARCCGRRSAEKLYSEAIGVLESQLQGGLGPQLGEARLAQLFPSLRTEVAVLYSNRCGQPRTPKPCVRAPEMRMAHGRAWQQPLAHVRAAYR